jgi:elongation factor 1-gamma
MSYKLIAQKDSPLAAQILIAAAYNGITIETTPDFVVGRDNKTPEFLKKNPNGKVPVLETEEGSIWETTAILRYIARLDENTQLLGATYYENALVDQWIDFVLTEVQLPSKVWIYPILGYLEADHEAISKAKTDLRRVLSILDAHLATQTFLVGERLTLADIVVGLSLHKLYTLVFDQGFRKQFVNTNRWFETLVNQPHFKKVLGETVLCQKAAPLPKPAEKKEAKKEEKKEVKKEEKKPAPAPKADDDEVPEKPRSLLDTLPKSSLDLDEWKRTYSNNDTAVAMKWFWENFDKEGWSIWFSDYKYADELESLLKTCNLVGGWYQRLDRMRKYGFANSIILASNKGNYHEISNCWLVRGTTMPKEMTDCDDYELYEWTKVENTDDEAVRAKIHEYWSWEGSFEGRKFVQGKTFK